MTAVPFADCALGAFAQVRTAAHAALGQVIRHFSDQDKEVHVCPLLEKLASEDIDDEYRAEAIMVRSCALFFKVLVSVLSAQCYS
jgi:hypothetical protein